MTECPGLKRAALAVEFKRSRVRQNLAVDSDPASGEIDYIAGAGGDWFQQRHCSIRAASWSTIAAADREACERLGRTKLHQNPSAALS